MSIAQPDSTRQRLANRRASQNFTFEVGGLPYDCTYSHFDDGRLAEIFLTACKVGSAAGAMASDAAVVASIAMQYGAPVETIRRALMRDARGRASGPLAAALDHIAGNAP